MEWAAIMRPESIIDGAISAAAEIEDEIIIIGKEDILNECPEERRITRAHRYRWSMPRRSSPTRKRL
jgi:hypothetical protein